MLRFIFPMKHSPNHQISDVFKIFCLLLLFKRITKSPLSTPSSKGRESFVVFRLGVRALVGRA